MRLSSSFLGLLALAALATASPLAKILIFSRTLGYRHDSIPTAISQLKAHGPSASPTAIQFDATEDPTFFTSGNLSQYDALLFLMTTDSSDTPRVEVLDSDQKTAFLHYLGAGGNYIGIHAASDSLTSTPFFGNETGAYFDYHPALQNGTVIVLNALNPATSSMPTRWNYEEEFYNFKSDPRTLGATVLLTVDESTYTDTGTRKYDEGTPHPLAWVQDHGAGASFASPAPSISATGRSFYTSLGHLNSTWETSTYMDHVMGGIGWALLSNTTLAFSASGKVGNPSSGSNSSTTGTSTGAGTKTTNTPQTFSATSAPKTTTTHASGSSRRMARWWRVAF